MFLINIQTYTKLFLYLSIIIPTVVLIVTVIRIIICVESTHVFSTIVIVDAQFLFAQTFHNSILKISHGCKQWM